MPADLREALSNTFAGRYHVERELGRGGMATVYLVRDVRHDRPLALKVLHPELAAFLGRERFLREIAVASHLTHPNILPLHDSGEADGLLFYLMPYVEGETLRDRLVKEHPLPLDDALRIARDVAAALSYAHDHNIVHRDIKPSNILLQAGAAVVADFGIARAIRKSVDEDALTDSGLVLGTPAYMSPEQANAEAVDGRSDIYSLGCVLYEMLAGGPPFSASSGRTLLARHSLDPVPPLRTVRPSLPVAIERAVMKALEKEPADRWGSAGEFAAALQMTGSHETAAMTARPIQVAVRPRPLWSSRRTLLAAGLMLGAGAAWLGWRQLSGATPDPVRSGLVPDTSLYVVLPLSYDSTARRFDAAQMLQDALERWDGVRVLQQFQVREALGRRDTANLDGEGARRVALQLGAGRYIRVAVSPFADSIRVQAVLYDATAPLTAPPLADGTRRVAADLKGSDAALGSLADQLLLRGEARDERAEVPGSISLPARQSFAMGEAALQEWNLARADSHFTRAAGHDDQYSRAHLWMALARIWAGQPVARWRSPAERAASGRERLSTRDRAVADAILALSRDDLVAACRTWAELTQLNAHDFIAWYGRADCLRRDDVVIRARGSPTGWRFRSSYNQTLTAYQRAFQLLPSMHRALQGGSFGSVRALLRTSRTQLRSGRALPPDTTTFRASPSWEGDSLVFHPVPASEIARGGVTTTISTNEAIRRLRGLFHEIAAGWVAASPQSAEALEALAVALELLGDPAALDTLGRARQLARSHADSSRIAGTEVWLRVKLSLPLQPSALVAARQLADSLLSSARSDNPPNPRLLASLAALTGRAHLAAALSRHAAVRGAWRVPPALASVAPALLVYGAMGGPVDSLRALERAVAGAIDRSLGGAERPAARLEWLAYAATLAFPEHRLASIAQLAGTGDYLLDAQAGFARGDSAEVRRILGRMSRIRSSTPPFDLSLDALYPEAWLLAAVGDPTAAISWLEPTLQSLSATDPQMFADAARAGPLVRAMAFRAELADRAGDWASARQWATAVSVLWANADDFLQPGVRRMEELARQ